MIETRQLRQRWLPFVIFFGVFSGHALYLRHQGAMPSSCWPEVGIGQSALWGFEYYVRAQDYLMGFSYALGTAFTVWAFLRFVAVRQAAMAAGAVGGVTLVGVLMGAGCFMVGCCGSPMLGVYAGIFGIKALGVGKPFMAFITAVSVGGGYWYLSRRQSRTCGCDKEPIRCEQGERKR